jgi:hypothetical protein
LAADFIVISPHRYLALSVSRCPDQLLIDELSNAKLGQFTTETGVLYSAKWKIRSGPGRLVDEDHACIDLACDALPAFYVFRNYRSAKAVGGVICQFDRFIIGRITWD